MTLLREQDVPGLARLVVEERRALRHLLGRLWDPEAGVRRAAARAVGIAAQGHADLGTEITRRLLWNLNDESATNGVNGIPALGEIGREAPDVFAPFVSPLMAFCEDAGLRVPILDALTRMAEEHPDIVREHVGYLRTHIPNTDEAAQAALARLDRALGGKHDA